MIRKDFITQTTAVSTLGWLNSEALVAKEPTEDYLKIAKAAQKLGFSGPLNVLYPTGSEANLGPVIQLFSNLTNISVNLIEAPRDEMITYILLGNMQKKSTFDVALAATFGLPDLIQTGAIVDLSDYSKKYEPDVVRQKSLYNVGHHYGGRFYGYLADGDVYLMFYNKNFMMSVSNKKKYREEYGIDLKSPATWDELDQQIRFFYEPNKNRYGGCLFRNSFYVVWEWWLRFHAKGFYPFDNKLKPQIDLDAGVEALEDLINITTYLHPNVMKDNAIENFKNFSKGHSYCNLGWGGTQKYLTKLQSPLLKNLGYALPPGLAAKDKVHRFSYFNWGSSYTVSSKSKHRELAYLFALFASTPMPSTLSVREVEGYFDPYRIEHYADTMVQNCYGKEFLTIHKRGISNCIPDLYLKGQSEYMNALRQNIDLALQNKLKPRQAMKITANEWEKISDAQGREGQLEQWRNVKMNYPKRLRDHLK